MREKLGGARLVVVANREPYMHMFTGAEVRCEQPASGYGQRSRSGVLRACNGLWVAHGSGSADRLTVDRDDRVAVPPDNPQYTLKRVWLTKEEEAGIITASPTTRCGRSVMWCSLGHALYSAIGKPMCVNAKFAQAILNEIQQEPAVVWIQDYHFALLPRLLKEARPDLLVARSGIFPGRIRKRFAVPWKQDILWGLLANDLLGFHIRYHCDNFLATVDREWKYGWTVNVPPSSIITA